MTEGALHCLVISDGRSGIENQALGLAESCAALRTMTVQSFHIQPGKALAALPPKAQLRLAKFNLPDCDIAIGCGRQAIAPLLYLKRSRPEIMTVYVQDPRMDPAAFDLVIAPEHDDLRSENVETMIGSPNRVTKEKIIGDTLDFAKGLTKLSMPRAAMLIGGTSKTHKLDLPSHEAHMAAAQTLLSQGPYFAFLGGADIILVTEDSTNMLTEGCSTGKPIYRLPMAGKPGKFQQLYDALEIRCGVTRYNGQDGREEYVPLNETARIAQIVWDKYDQRN